MPESHIKHANFVYRRILGEHPGEGAKEFIKHLSWIGASFILAKIISSLINIAAGRALGPREYGQISVLVSTGTAIAPFLLAGLNYSTIKFGTETKDRDRVFTTAAAVFLGLSVLAGAIVTIFRVRLSSFLGISQGMLLLSLAYAFSMSAFVLTSSIQQSLGSFSKRGLSEIGFSVLLAAGFFAGLFYFGRSYKVMAWAYIAAFSSLSIYWLFRIGSVIKPGLLDRKRFLAMSEYGLYYFGAALGSFLVMNVQNLILNACLTRAEVGIYAAYNTATIGISGYLGYAIGTVLFPKASASTNRQRLWDMGTKIWLYLAPASVLVFVALEIAILSLMGRHQYGMDPLLMVLFSCCGTLMLAYNSMAQIIFSEGIKASRLAMAISLGAGAVNFAACILLVPYFKVMGAAAAFIITYSLMLAWLWKAKTPYLGQPADRKRFSST